MVKKKEPLNNIIQMVKIKIEGNLKNDKLNGVAKSYDENGKLIEEVLFKDDVQVK